MSKHKGRMALGIVLAAVAAVCAVVAVDQYMKQKMAGDTYDNLRKEVVASSAPLVTPEATSAPESVVESVPETPTPTPTEAIPVDFAALRAKCPDAYAWITIPDTNVDYPIVQSATDNSYYLNHTSEGEARIEGAIFTENINSRDFTDPVTVVYGHNMRNGSMFRTLHKFEDRAFFESHREFTVYTENAAHHYKIMAAVTHDNSHILNSNDFSKPENVTNFLNLLLANKTQSDIIDSEISTAGENGKLLILSTCNGNSDQRFLVIAKKEQ
ncbi:MAG: class B sortase [Lachnospiraceae bacterium]|nr:class B sortase [Lachnospiraceae bacterium]